MSKEEALDRLLLIAKGNLESIDGEWGCCHDFDQMKGIPSCWTHDAAVELLELEQILRA